MAVLFDWGPRNGSQTPNRSERPGKPVTLLDSEPRQA